MEHSFQVDQIVQRYETVAERSALRSSELQNINIDREFISVLLQSFEDLDLFSADDYDRFSLRTILENIRRTHCFYLSKKLLEIEQSISILLKNHEGDHPLSRGS